MNLYDAMKDVLGWLKKEQEASILYHVLKNRGKVEPVAEELSAPEAQISIYRDRLEDAGYLGEAHTSGRLEWYLTIRGEELLRHLEADRSRK